MILATGSSDELGLEAVSGGATAGRALLQADGRDVVVSWRWRGLAAPACVIFDLQDAVAGSRGADMELCYPSRLPTDGLGSRTPAN